MSDRERLVGAMVVDGCKNKLGVVTAVLLQTGTLHPRWLSVRLDDGAERLLPLAAATRNAANRLVVPYALDVVSSAPVVGTDALTIEQAARLSRHYGWPDSTAGPVVDG